MKLIHRAYFRRPTSKASNIRLVNASLRGVSPKNSMNHSSNNLSLSKAALLAGIGYVLMMATPFVEFYALPKLIVSGDGAATVKNLIDQEALFRYAITGYLVNFTGDVLAAWALYVLLKPVHGSLSLLASWLRLIYT